MIMNPLLDVELTYDHEYTEFLHDRIRVKYGSTVKRTATHATDLLYCLRKAWLKQRIPEDQWAAVDPENDPMLMWAQGLQFEDLISDGQRQRAQAYCPTCRAVSAMPPPYNGEEVSRCPVCHNRWLVGTPDFTVPLDGYSVLHEAKQTRKSQRRGVEDAPWWVEQLVTYMFFEHMKAPGDEAGPDWGRLVVNWLMGTYGNKRKGKRPQPPRSALDAFRMKVKGDWREIESELLRRKAIVEGPEMPPLAGMSTEPTVDSPRYEFECPTCPVGRIGGCELYVWDEADNLIEEVVVEEVVAEHAGDPPEEEVVAEHAGDPPEVAGVST